LITKTWLIVFTKSRAYKSNRKQAVLHKINIGVIMFGK